MITKHQLTQNPENLKLEYSRKKKERKELRLPIHFFVYEIFFCVCCSLQQKWATAAVKNSH